MRREEEAAKELTAKEQWKAEVLAKQSRTAALLAESQERKAAAERAEVERIENERKATALRKAQATLQFEEERKMRAMTPEQLEAYTTKKKEEAEAVRAEAERVRLEAEQRETQVLEECGWLRSVKSSSSANARRRS